MTLPWLGEFRAAMAKVDGPIVLSLATVNGGGNPRVRSVVCRRIDEHGGIWITSDARSAKNLDVLAHPKVAAACWIREAGVQFRFTGEAEIVRDGDDLKRVWEELKPETKVTFFWPAPGEARGPDATFETQCNGSEMAREFSVIVVRPSEVEALEVEVTPHRRRRWVLEGEWRVIELNP
jgi:pyridoxamine 5'-phosphate oxidase